jgi:hypothetical protein
MGVGIRKKFLEKIKRKEEEIQRYENSIREARAYLRGLQDAIRLLPRENGTKESAESKLRAGSTTSKTLEFLRKANKPMYITSILKGIGKEITKENRMSLAGTLGLYVRKNEIFTRPAPNKFGLIDMKNGSKKEPPINFGLLDETEEDEVPF